MPKRWFSFASLALLVLVVLAACGGDAEEEDVTRVSGVEGAPVFEVAQETGGTPTGGEETGPTSGEQASPTGDVAQAPPAAASIELVGIDIGWEYGDLNTLDGDAVTLTVAPGTIISLPNAGGAEHNFAVDELAIDVDMPVGATVEATIPADAKPGQYEFYCNVPGHRQAGMVGTLIIEAGGAPEAAGGPPAGAPPAEGASAEGAPPAGAPPAGAAPPPQPVTIASVDIAFEPDAVTIPANADVPVALPNNGAGEHNFSIDELDISVDQAPGAQDQQTTINAEAGSYEYYCNVPGHRQAGMVGTLTVE